MLLPSGRVHDRTLLDALETIDPAPFSSNVWRVTRKGRDPLRGSSAHGRWSPPGGMEVLYTSFVAEGALAEVGYRLSLEPVWPSRMEHEIHSIKVRLQGVLKIESLSDLARFGVDTTRYETFDYAATQALAAAAHFLERDGLIAPSARAACHNLAVFMDRLGESHELELQSSEPVDWERWRNSSRRQRNSI